MNDSGKNQTSGIVIGILIGVIAVVLILIIVLLWLGRSSGPETGTALPSEAAAGTESGETGTAPESAAATTFAAAAESAGEESSGQEESETAPPAGAVVVTDLFAVNVPEAWDGKVDYQIFPGEYSGYSLEFSRKTSKDAGMGGFLFAISLYDEAIATDFRKTGAVAIFLRLPAKKLVGKYLEI